MSNAFYAAAELLPLAYTSGHGPELRAALGAALPLLGGSVLVSASIVALSPPDRRRMFATTAAALFAAVVIGVIVTFVML